MTKPDEPIAQVGSGWTVQPDELDKTVRRILIEFDNVATVTDEDHLARYKEAEAAINSLTLKQVLSLTDSLPERGFGIPKEGTPDHAKGTFTKLISADELRQSAERIWKI